MNLSLFQYHVHGIVLIIRKNNDDYSILFILYWYIKLIIIYIIQDISKNRIFYYTNSFIINNIPYPWEYIF